MRLWQALVAMIWVAFLAFLIVMSTPVTPFASIANPLIDVHAGLGFAMILLAFNNHTGVRNTTIACRVKRTPSPGPRS